MLTLIRFRTMVLAALLVSVGADAGGFDSQVTLPGHDYLTPIMTAELNVCCDGMGIKAKGFLESKETWTATGIEAKHFSIVAEVMVPNKVEGFRSLEEALAADVRVTINRKGDDTTAECLLVTQPFVIGDPIDSRFAGFGPGGGVEPFDSGLYMLTYKVDLVQKGSTVYPLHGVCDVDMFQFGTQVGIPHLETNDYVLVVNQMDGYRVNLLNGHCE